MTDFHYFVSIALGFCCGTFFWTVLCWAIVKRGR